MSKVDHRAGARGKKAKKRKDQGMTLVELLVVLVVLGLISVIAVPRVMSFLGGAKIDAAEIDMKRLAGILDIYRLDNGRYPTTDEGLQALSVKPGSAKKWRGPYLDDPDSAIDPWGAPFIYKSPGDEGRPYGLKTLGADGQPGGTGEDADLTL